MAIIIDLDEVRRRSAGRTRMIAGPAEIIPFTGVRYERWSPENTSAPERGRAKPARRRTPAPPRRA